MQEVKATPKKRTAAKKGITRKPVPKKRASRPPVAKKKTAPKAAPKKAAPKKKVVAKKSAPAKKAPAKKTSAKKVNNVALREVNEHGYIPGTDSALICDILLAGGTDRADINEKVVKKIGLETRNGTEKNIPALVSGVLNTLLRKGYKTESSFVVLPPARRRAKK